MLAKLKQYGIYILISIASLAMGAAVSHFYSNKIINSLQSEIDTDKKSSIQAIKDHQSEIDTINSQSVVIKEKNNNLAKQVELEKRIRNSYILSSQVDSNHKIYITNNKDTILDYLREILNK